MPNLSWREARRRASPVEWVDRLGPGVCDRAGSVEVQSGTRPAPSPAVATRQQLADVWHVVVLNDPVNLMSYVVMVFKKVLGFDETRARRHMLEVHELGRSAVWTGQREQAEAYAFTLQKWHLTAVIESDKAG